MPSVAKSPVPGYRWGKAGLGLSPRAFKRSVRWQVADAEYPPEVLARMTPLEVAALARFNREFHGGRFSTNSEGEEDLQSLQVLRRERWNAADAAERDIMSNWTSAGPLTLDMVGTVNPYED